jgi:putative N6-adenine-specific DNA methylase
MASALRFVATCVPGVEPWVARELATLGVTTSASVGAVTGRATLPDLRQVLSEAKLIESVRVRPVQSFHAPNFEALCRGLEKVPWHAYLVAAYPLEVRVTCHKSRLYHSDAVAERVRRVIAERTKREWPEPAQTSVNNHCNRVYLRLDADEVEVGLDPSGEALHRRGYRKHVQDAPIRETLAALLLALANDAASQAGGGNAPINRVWDPCCGSGTIPLEWLAKHLRLPMTRRFLMDEWACARGAEAPPVAAAGATPDKLVWGCDISDRAVDASWANADALGVRDWCTFAVSDCGDFETTVPKGAALVTNLPYGVRLNTRQEAAKLFQRLDVMLSRRKDLRPAVVLWGGGKQTPQLRNDWQLVISFKNGGLPVAAFVLR